MRKFATILGTILLPGVVAAHPEHASVGDAGLLHFVTDPFHVGLTLVAVVFAVAVRKSMTRRQSLSRSNS